MKSKQRPILSLWRPAALALLVAVALTASCKSSAKQATPGSSEGAMLYTENCAACHGAGDRGDGPAARAVQVRPRDFWNEPFRYVSSLNGAPTKADINQTIRDGLDLP